MNVNGLLADSMPLRQSWLFQQLSVFVVFQHAHLLYCYLVELEQSFMLWHPLADEYGVEAFHVGQADDFVY